MSDEELTDGEMKEAIAADMKAGVQNILVSPGPRTSTIRFRASLPPTQTAINIHGVDALRITLEVPDSDVPEALKMVLFRGKAFTVTVEGKDTPQGDWPPAEQEYRVERMNPIPGAPEDSTDDLGLEWCIMRSHDNELIGAYHTREEAEAALRENAPEHKPS